MTEPRMARRSTSSLISMPSNWRCLAAPTAFAIWRLARVRRLARPRNKCALRARPILPSSRPPMASASRAIILSSTATSAPRLASMIVFLGSQRDRLRCAAGSGDRHHARACGRRRSARKSLARWIARQLRPLDAPEHSALTLLTPPAALRSPAGSPPRRSPARTTSTMPAATSDGLEHATPHS